MQRYQVHPEWRVNAAYLYLEVRCLGCDTHQTVALDVVRRPKITPIHELERYMRCEDCSQVRGYAYKRSHLVVLRHRKISVSDPASTWWPGERREPPPMRASQVVAKTGLHRGTAAIPDGLIADLWGPRGEHGWRRIYFRFRRHKGRDRNCCWLGSVESDP